jgi:hypothetical protein
MNPSIPIDRAEINRQNAAHSTGPITQAGRRRVSLNALRHGLTGHTVVLPSDDLAAYQKHCGEFHTELKPQGLIESKCVQTIADTYWRLDRIRAMENSLFGLAVSQECEMSPDPDPLIDCALAQAKSLEQHSDLLIRLSLYENRLIRTLEKAKAELKQLQQERAKAREKALYEAAKIANLKEALHEPWDPRDDGFEFSAEDVTARIRRVELDNAALMFFINGTLPAPPAPVRRK